MCATYRVSSDGLCYIGLQVTCGVAATVLDDVLRRIKRSTARKDVKARFIVSGEGDWRFLDIVSLGSGKHQVGSWRCVTVLVLMLSLIVHIAANTVCWADQLLPRDTGARVREKADENGSLLNTGLRGQWQRYRHVGGREPRCSGWQRSGRLTEVADP